MERHRMETNLVIVSNQERNIALAMSSALTKKKARSDIPIDPLLQGPLGNPPNAITISENDDGLSGKGDLDELDDDLELNLNDDA